MVSFAGAVLAGGESRRMGRNKALIEKDGKTLWQFQVEALVAAQADPVFVSLRTDQTWLPAGISCVRDDGFSGAMGGLAAALAELTTTHLLALAVDLPQLPLTWWQLLRDVCLPGVGAVGRQPAGYFEPLAAIYPKAMLARIEAARISKDFSLQHLIDAAVANGQMREITIAQEQSTWFTNWNTPSDVSGL